VTSRTLILALSALCFTSTTQAWEYDPWALCPDPTPRQSALIDESEPLDENLRLSADMGQMIIGNKVLLTGNVIGTYQGRTVFADKAIYDQTNNTLDLTGNIRFESPELDVSGSEAHFDLKNETGQFPIAAYYITQQHGRGVAQNINVIDPERVKLDTASYTTCPAEQEDWLIRANRVYLDQVKGRGSARHARMSFKGKPFIYLPYMSFPLDDRRKTGVLFPEVGYSNNRGAEFGLPVYWNIAPAMDATFTPRLMSYRGFQLGSEYRYLARKHNGIIGLDYTPEDKLTKEERWFYSVDLKSKPTTGLSSRIFLNSASDEDYFRDFSTNLAVSSTTHLERTGELNYRNRYWSTLFRVQNYQTIDPEIAPSSRPYQRLPQLRADGRLDDGPGNLEYRLLSEWVHFYRENSVTGGRLDLEPGIALPFYRPGYFIEPELSYRFTQYQLEDVTGVGNDAITRGLPTFSLDGGLIFERPVGSGMKHTLEPRVFYLYTPYVDQDEIPIFDTIETDFSFGQLFRRDRYVGADRVGDANQVSLALTSRVLQNSSGSELLSGSIGQIFYFQDLQVTLPGQLPTETPSSNFLAEVVTEPIPRWRGSLAWQWNPDLGETDRSSASVQYLRDPRHVVNLGYRFAREDFEQTDLSMAWPMTRQWQALARWAYSIKDRDDVAFVAGLEYESCCWKSRFVARHYVNGTPGGEYTTGIYFQMVFKGLGSLGTEADSILEQNIPGYKTYDNTL
jgi:LPS-assembly protein